jgi:nitrite reductase (NADH) small subunit/3-phenylpropionate/trans-cinnamate dioxygenase ferredoxin subunit
VEEVPPGTGRVVDVAGAPVALFNVGGRFHAIANTCPHQGGPLGEGFLDGCIVTCPWHFWQFDVTKGQASEFPEMTIDRYVVKVEAGEVHVSDTPLTRVRKEVKEG